MTITSRSATATRPARVTAGCFPLPDCRRGGLMPATDSRSRSSSPYAVEQMAGNLHGSPFGAWLRLRAELGLLGAGARGFVECWHCVGLDATGVVMAVPVPA